MGAGVLVKMCQKVCHIAPIYHYWYRINVYISTTYCFNKLLRQYNKVNYLSFQSNKIEFQSFHNKNKHSRLTSVELLSNNRRAVSLGSSQLPGPRDASKSRTRSGGCNQLRVGGGGVESRGLDERGVYFDRWMSVDAGSVRGRDCSQATGERLASVAPS